jgi:hypothetical protein
MLRTVRKLLISKPMSHEKLVDQLQTGGVPVSLDSCRYCSDPCEDGHDDYPNKFDVDTESQLIGTVKPYNLQVHIIQTDSASVKIVPLLFISAVCDIDGQNRLG